MTQQIELPNKLGTTTLIFILHLGGHKFVSNRSREEWELSSPKSYYLVDHAMTAHMTGPQFHRHLHRAPSTGGGAVTQPDNT